MSKAKRVVLIFLVVMALVITGLLIVLKNKPVSSDIVFFYGEECPHCALVEEHIRENNISSKLVIISREVYHDQKNALELQQAAARCGIRSNEIGVPLIFFENKCYVGDKEGIDFLDSKVRSIQ